MGATNRCEIIDFANRKNSEGQSKVDGRCGSQEGRIKKLGLKVDDIYFNKEGPFIPS